MGRFSPTVNPQFPVGQPKGTFLFDRLEDFLEDLGERRERRRREDEERELRDLTLAQRGIFRGEAEPPSLTARETGGVTETRLPEPELDDDLASVRARTRGLFDQLPQRTAPGGAVEEFASMAGEAARRGPPERPKRVPPGAFNPIRGTFEPAVSVRETEFEADVPQQRQLTENFFLDLEQTPEARREAAEAEEFAGLFERARGAGLVEPEDVARAEITGLEETVGFRDKRREAEENRGANREAYREYVEALNDLDPNIPTPAFTDDVNWVDEQIELARDLRNEQQIRTRPRRGRAGGATTPTAEGGFPEMSVAQANNFIDDLEAGLPDPESPGDLLPIPPRIRARLMRAATTGNLTMDIIDEAVAEITGEEAGSETGIDRIVGQARTLAEAGPPRGPLQEARVLVQGLPQPEAEAALREAGYTDDEIEQILQ